jgi:hypothetical protein
LRAFTELTDEPVVQNVELKANDNTVLVTMERGGGGSEAAPGSAGAPDFQSDKFGAPRGGAVHK